MILNRNELRVDAFAQFAKRVKGLLWILSTKNVFLTD